MKLVLLGNRINEVYISYFDESGDDGFPQYSSELFTLTSIYFNHQDWKTTYESLHRFRLDLKTKFGLPAKTELKIKDFLLYKKQYWKFKLSDTKRRDITYAFSEEFSKLPIKAINVVINKKKIKTKTYGVLDTAVKYNIQRIENDLLSGSKNKFMVITDEGRVGKMVKTARQMQKINYIVSKYSGSYRKEIELLIEDPLGKNSKESYFIQVADYIAFFIYNFSILEYLSGSLPKRLSLVIDKSYIDKILDNLKSIFNLKASKDKYGIVCYPK